MPNCVVHPLIQPNPDGSCPWCAPCPIHGPNSRDPTSGDCYKCQYSATVVSGGNAYMVTTETDRQMQSMMATNAAVRGLGAAIDQRGEDKPLLDDLGDWEEETGNRGACHIIPRLCGFWALFFLPTIFISIFQGATWAIIVGLVLFLPISAFAFVWCMAWYRRVWFTGGIPTIGEEHVPTCSDNLYTYYQQPCFPSICRWAHFFGYFGLVRIKRVAGGSNCEHIRGFVLLAINIVVFVAGVMAWLAFIGSDDSSSSATTSITTTRPTFG